MQKYECPRCEYNTVKRNDIIRHYKRKQLCKAIDDDHDVCLDDIYNQYGLLEDEPIQDLVYEHVKLKCQVQDIQKELNELRKLITNNPPAINNNLIINTNNFGEEDVSHLTYEFQKKCLLQGQEGLINRFKEINFNDDKPCNHNVRISSKKRKEFKVFHKNRWVAKDANKFYLEILCKQKSELYKFYKENVEKDKELLMMTDIFEVFKSMLKANCKEFYANRRDLISFIGSYKPPKRSSI